MRPGNFTRPHLLLDCSPVIITDLSGVRLTRVTASLQPCQQYAPGTSVEACIIVLGFDTLSSQSFKL